MMKYMFMSVSLLLLQLTKITPMWTWTAPLSFILASTMLLSIYNPLLTPYIHTSFIGDPLAVALSSLTIWITGLMFMASWKVFLTYNSPKSFFNWIILLAIILILAFFSNNMLYFYFMFEASLIPILMLILGWGYQPERLQAGLYMMLYTILASLPLLISITLWGNTLGHTSMLLPWSSSFLSPSMSNLWWYMSILAFLVKLPMFSVHLWLPKAHVEAPVAGSMILAAILLKLGGYGLMRMLAQTKFLSPANTSLIISISLVGASLTSLICLRQSDLKALVAYSSVGHMGLMIAGATSMSNTGNLGAMSMMIAHGLSSSALFAISNMTYETTNTRSIYLTKGMGMISPYISLWWFLLVACNMAAPPTINLFSEIFLITSIINFAHSSWFPVALTSFLSAAYSLFLYTTSQHGSLPQFSNPLSINLPKNSSTIIFHLTPIILLISKPEIISIF